MENKLRLAIKLFENKINETEEKYMEKCKGNFDREKMRRYVNRKLKKERAGLIMINLIPSLQILASTKTFKY